MRYAWTRAAATRIKVYLTRRVAFLRCASGSAAQHVGLAGGASHHATVACAHLHTRRRQQLGPTARHKRRRGGAPVAEHAPAAVDCRAFRARRLVVHGPTADASAAMIAKLKRLLNADGGVAVQGQRVAPAQVLQHVEVCEGFSCPSFALTGLTGANAVVPGAGDTGAVGACEGAKVRPSGRASLLQPPWVTGMTHQIELPCAPCVTCGGDLCAVHVVHVWVSHGVVRRGRNGNRGLLCGSTGGTATVP